MRVPWWAFAIAMVLGVVSITLSIRERAAYAVRLAAWHQYADSAARVTVAAREGMRIADSARADADRLRDSAAVVILMSSQAATVAREQANKALARLRADSMIIRDTTVEGVTRRAEIKVLSDLLLMDSAVLVSAHFGHIADSAAIAKARKSIYARDVVINGLQQELRLARDKPVPGAMAARFTPFADGGVGVSGGSSKAGAGIVVAGGVAMRLFGPLSVVGRLQYDGAVKTGSAQALVHFTF